ncbi:MAG: hypothetical protein HYV93_18280 [Candidatus Rokubacteria bacterium]|nr:hypothetical protein [Candidatus Rokubacteria bacterium]
MERAGFSPRPGRWTRLAAWLTLVVSAVLLGIALSDVQLAARLASEDDALEWLQVILLVAAAAVSARCFLRQRARQQSGAPDLLLTAVFGVLIVGELEVQRRLVGAPLKLRRLLGHPAAAPLREWALAVAIGAFFIALVAYALYHRVELWRWARTALSEAWGRLLLTGVTVFGVTELFERRFNRTWATVLPRNFVEETLELLAALYFLLAMLERESPRDDRPSP